MRLRRTLRRTKTFLSPGGLEHIHHIFWGHILLDIVRGGKNISSVAVHDVDRLLHDLFHALFRAERQYLLRVDATVKNDPVAIRIFQVCRIHLGGLRLNRV